MKFGVYLRKEHTYPKMLKLAKKADDLGYFGGFLNDHVIGFADNGKEYYLEAWTAMTGIGMATKQLRVGQIVLFNSLRNPAYLAKSIATLDQMTNGRYELLIGAGWNEREYWGYDLMEKGRGMPSAKERVDRFEESVQILNLMLKQEETDFEGNYWKLKGAINIPQPVQKPMRLSVGCKGTRMMTITAKHADGINIGGTYLPDAFDYIDKFENIVMDKTPNTLDKYFISGFGGIKITNNKKNIRNSIIDMKDEELSYEDVKDNYLIGTPETIISNLSRLKDRGMDAFIGHIDVDPELSDDKLIYFKDNIISNL